MLIIMKIKKFFFYLFFLTYLSCCYSIEKDFIFYGTSKKKQYSIKNFKNQIEKEYNTQFPGSPIFILLQTPSHENSKYVKQHKIFDSLDHDFFENNFIIIIASCTNSNCSGYHIPMEKAEKADDFKILILNNKGDILFSGEQILNTDKLKEIIEKKKSVDN